MKGVVSKLFVVVPIVALTSVSLIGDVKTTDRASVKFEGMLGHVVGFFGGKAAKEGVESSVAVKGNRKATFNDSTGQIVDLSEEKVYDIDMHKKTYTVTTFDEIRQKMREEAERAQKEAKEQPGQPQPEQKPEKPQKEYEVDFDVKETGQKKQLAGYDTHEVIATVTVREKGKTLEDGGGVVMTNDMWLGPEIPQLREVAAFDMKLLAAAPAGRPPDFHLPRADGDGDRQLPGRAERDGAVREGRRQAPGHGARYDEHVRRRQEPGADGRGAEAAEQRLRQRRQSHRDVRQEDDEEEGAAQAARHDPHDASRGAQRQHDRGRRRRGDPGGVQGEAEVAGARFTSTRRVLSPGLPTPIAAPKKDVATRERRGSGRGCPFRRHPTRDSETES